MLQQKQQKYAQSRAYNNSKTKQKVGFLMKKSILPPIQTQPVRKIRQKSNPQQNPIKIKRKLPDIFYLELNQVDKAKRQSKPDSALSHYENEKDFTNKQQQKQSTVLKRIQKQSNTVPNICENHQKKLIMYYQSQKLKNNQKKSRILKTQASRVDECQSSQKTQNTQSRKNSFVNRNHFSLNQLQLRNNKVTPKKLKPIKINSYQRAQCYDSRNNQYELVESRQSNYREPMTRKQIEQISNKLSTPKCELKCTKKNCECFLFNQDNLPTTNSRSSPFIKINYEKQLPKNKLKINTDRLQQLNQSPNNLLQKVQMVKQNHTSLKKKLEQRKILLNRRRLKVLKDQHSREYDIQYGKVYKSKTQVNPSRDDRQHQASEGDLYDSKISSDQADSSFIKGIVSSSKTTIDKDNKNYKRKQKLKTVEIQIQTEDILLRASEQDQKQLQKQENYDKQPSQKDLNHRINPVIDIKKSYSFNTIKQESIQDTNKYETINSDSIPINSSASNKLNNSQQGIQKIKNRQNPKIKGLNYTLNFSNQQQKSNMQEVNKNKRSQPLHQEIKKSIDLKFASQVIKQKVDMRSSTQKDKNQIIEPNQNKSKKLNLQVIQQIPISFQVRKQTNSLSQIISQISEKDRNCISSSSGKKSINMFNRNSKSIASSRSKRYFKIPKQQQTVSFIKNYQPINPQINLKSLPLKQNFKAISSLTKLYFGEIIGESTKHGLGVQITINEIFQGQYEDDKRKKGYLKTHQGIYNGNFLNNLRHGHGIFKNDNGQQFEGQWRMGTKNGFGKWKSPTGDYYEGQWHMNMQHGKGKFVHSNSIYQGEFKNFLKDGYGEQIFHNGHKYSGLYKEGKPNGRGRYQWPDQTYYQGDFLNGLRHGNGKWHQNSQSLYEGEFFQDQKHGKGNEYYKDGSYLQGQWENSKCINGKLFNKNKQLVKNIVVINKAQ